MRYEIDQVAYADLQDIYRWGYERFGEIAAESYYLGLIGVFELLSENPRLGRSLGKYRGHIHRSHVVVYRVLDGGRIRVVRVLNTRQDWRKHID